jgi:hypothetical protein
MTIAYLSIASQVALLLILKTGDFVRSIYIRVHEYHRSCWSRLPKFHKVRYFSVLSRSDCPTVRLAKKSVVVRWEIVGNWLDHN